MSLYNEFEPFSKLVNSEFYNDSEIFQNWLHQEDEVRKKILGSLEFLAIKNTAMDIAITRLLNRPYENEVTLKEHN